MADKIELNESLEDKFDIVEEKTYRDRNTGMRVIEEIPLHLNSGPPDYITNNVKRFGSAHIPTQMGNMPFKFNFPEEFNILECFEHFQECAETALDQLEREANERNQIIIPQGINVDSLKVK